MISITEPTRRMQTRHRGSTDKTINQIKSGQVKIKLNQSSQSKEGSCQINQSCNHQFNLVVISSRHQSSTQPDIDNMPDSQSAKQYITCNTGENGIWEQTIHRKHLRVYNQKHGECGTQEHTGISPTQHTELNSIREETRHIHIAPNK